MLDRPLPILGRLTPADVLELIRCQPGALEQHARTLATCTHSKVKES